MSRWVDAAPVAEMTFDPGFAVHVEGRWLAVFPHAGGYRVIDNACPHASAPLCDGTLLDGKVICPLHLWEFDLTSGACDVGPDWSVTTYDARVLDGVLQVAMPS